MPIVDNPPPMILPKEMVSPNQPIQENSPKGSIFTWYPRYGGTYQMHPLTADQQKYDDTCREIDVLEEEIGNFSMRLFTADEFIRFINHVNHLYMLPSQEQLNEQVKWLRELKERLKNRD